MVKRPGFSAWVVAAGFFIALHYMNAITEFSSDAKSYWHLSTWRALVDFPRSIRGYFYPLLLAPVHLLVGLSRTSDFMLYRLGSSLAYAYVLTILLPAFWFRHFGGKDGFWRRLVVPALVCLLFPGIILYPLSDLPALSLMVGAVCCAFHASRNDGRASGYATAFLAGVLAYGAYNTRTIYLFSVIAMLVVGIAMVFNGGLSRTKALALSAFVMGMLVSSVPQILINQKNYDRPSPLVFATNQGKSLFTQQLLWGVGVQRYETALSKPRNTRVFYVDPTGLRLLEDSHLEVSRSGIADYFDLVYHHPLEFAGIFCRHLINGLDLRDGQLYTTVRSGTKHGVAFLNFLIVFSGLSTIVLGMARSRWAGKSMRPLAAAVILLLPVAAVIPGAIETRFFLAVHLAIYSAIAFNLDVSESLRLLRERWLPAIAVFAVALYLFFSVTLETMANVRYTYPDVYLRHARMTPPAGNSDPPGEN